MSARGHYALKDRGRDVAVPRVLYALAAGTALVWAVVVGVPGLLALVHVDCRPRLSLLEIELAVAAVALVLFAGGSRLVRGRPRPAVALEPDGVRLPRIPALRVATFVPYSRIRSLARLGRPVRWERLCIGIQGRLPIEVLRRALESPGELESIEHALRERAEAAGDAPARSAVLSGQEHLARAGRDRRLVVTTGVVVAVGLAWLLQLRSAASEDPFALTRLGANAPWLVARGELWRLVTSPFLHGGELHVLTNAVVLALLGRLYEPLLGPFRLAVLLTGTALAAAGVHALAETLPGVGISGAVYGVVGCAAALNQRFPTELPAPYRLPAWIWLGIPLFELLQVQLRPRLDWPVHAAGFGIGFALTLGALGRRELAVLAEPAARPTRAVAWACAGVVAAGVAWAGATAGARDAAWADEAMLPLLGREGLTPGQRNDLAWHYAASPHATREQLRRARAMARGVLAAHPGDSSYRDTAATLAFRLGDVETAAALEREVLRTRPERFFASQLARFLAVGPSGADDAWPGVRLDLESRSADGDLPVAVLRGPRGPGPGVAIEALVWGPDASLDGIALAWVDCPVEPEPAGCRVPARGLSPLDRLELTDLGPVPAGAVRPVWHFWPMDPAAAALPGPVDPASSTSPPGAPVGRAP